jgi:hypothetical protein
MKRTGLADKLTLIAALGALLAATLGCGIADRIRSAANNASSNRTTTEPPTRPPKSGAILFESQADINEFVTALTTAVGADNPNILKLNLYDSYAMAEVQDPKKPENIDGYTWRDGKLAGPNPVKIIGNGKIADNVFPLKDVNLDGLPDLTKEVQEKLKDVEGGKMIGYTVNRGLPFSKEIQITPLTNATRKSVYSQADKNAKLKKFEVK